MTKKEQLTGTRWSKQEDEQLKQLVQTHGKSNEAFKIIASLMGNKRSALNVENRSNLVLDKGLVKGSWSSNEDEIILKNTSAGVFDWNLIANQVQGRSAKQVRERFNNKLDPNLSSQPWTPEEDRHLSELQAEYGNSWKLIATKLKGRSENDIKNRWNKNKKSKSIPQKTKRAEDESIHFTSKKLKFDPITYFSSSTNYIEDSDSEDDELTSFRNKFVSFQKNVKLSKIQASNLTVITDSNTNYANISTDTSYVSSTDTSQSNTVFSETYKDNTIEEENYTGLISGFSSLTNSGRNSPISTDSNILFDICNEYDTLHMIPTSSNSSISLGSLSSLSFITLIKSVDDNIDAK